MFSQSLYYAARQVCDVQSAIRFATNRETFVCLIRADPSQLQRSAYSCCRLVLCRRVEFASPITIYDAAIQTDDFDCCLLTTYPDFLFALIDSKFGHCRVRCVFCWRCNSIVTPKKAHILPDSSYLRTRPPGWSLFAPPTVNVTSTSTKVPSSAFIKVTGTIALPSMAAAVAVSSLAPSTTPVSFVSPATVVFEPRSRLF